MNVVGGRIGVAQPAQRFNHVRLRIGLPAVDHVVNGLGTAKIRMLCFPCFRRDPAHVIGIGKEGRVPKITTQQTEFPEVVGDVFAHVGDGAVRTHDDLGVFVGTSLLPLLARRLPLPQWRRAASPSSPHSSLRSRDTTRLWLSAAQRRDPRISDGGSRSREAGNRIQSPGAAWFRDGGATPRSTQIRYLGDLVVPCLDSVQRVKPDLFTFPLFRLGSVVPLRNARIQVPAVIVDPLAFGRQVDKQSPDPGEIEPFEVRQPNHYIGYLHPCVVDVVLHIDPLPGRAQHQHECVAKNGIAQVTDVGGFIRD